MPKTVSIDYEGLKLVALGVEYSPYEAATLVDPAREDSASWDLLYIESDVGKNDLTRFFKFSTLDAIEESICEQLRGE